MRGLMMFRNSSCVVGSLNTRGFALPEAMSMEPQKGAYADSPPHKKNHEKPRCLQEGCSIRARVKLIEPLQTRLKLRTAETFLLL